LITYGQVYLTQKLVIFYQNFVEFSLILEKENFTYGKTRLKSDLIQDLHSSCHTFDMM